MAATKTKAKPAKAAPAKGKAATAKSKTTAKKANTAAAVKPKPPTNILEVGSFAKFGGYRSNMDEDEVVFAEGDVLYIVEVDDDDKDGILYSAINATELQMYNEEGEDAVSGGQVAPSEVSEIKGGALDKARAQYVPVEAMGRLAEMLEENDNPIEVAIELNQSIQETYFWLGGALAKVLQGQLHLKENGGDCEGDEAFNDFCQAEFGFKASKGQQLARVYVTFSNIPNFDPATLDAVGWSKAAIAERFVTEDNVDEVLELATETSQRELAHTLKVQYADENGATASGKAASRGEQIVKKSLSFRLDEDSAESVQLALQQCMKQNGIENEALALERICVEWAQENVQAASAKSRINAKANKAAKLREKATKPAKAEAPAKAKAATTKAKPTPTKKK
jgi:hypothetical protein